MAGTSRARPKSRRNRARSGRRVRSRTTSIPVSARSASTSSRSAPRSLICPDQIRESARPRLADLGDHGRIKALLLLAVFVALGFGVEWLFRTATGKIRRHLDAHPVETVNDRLRLVAGRFAFAVGLVAAFALGSVGAFLALDWPPLLREIVFGYLVAFLAIRIAIVVGHFLLAPDARALPHHSDGYRRRLGSGTGGLSPFVGWFALGLVTIGLLGTLGFSLEGAPARRLCARPRPPRDRAGSAFGAGPSRADDSRARQPSRRDASPRPRRAKRAAVGRHRAAVGALGGAGPCRASGSSLVVIILPLAISVTRRAVEHLLRPPGSTEAVEVRPSVIAVCLERGLRALLIIGAVRCSPGAGVSTSSTSPAQRHAVRPPRRTAC